MAPRLPRPAVALLGSCAALALYAALGFLLAPWLLRQQAVAFVRDHYHRELKLKDVIVDPFALSIELHDLALADADGQPLLGFQRLAVDFEVLASLWQRAYVFREISLREPRLRAIVRPDGSLNFSDLAGAEEPSSRPVSEPPALAIEQLRVLGGELEFSDRSRAEPFSQRFTPISFTLQGFRTTAAGGAFSLSARSEPEQRFWWRGSIALTPELASAGQFALANVSASMVADYLGEQLPFDVSDGKLSVSGKYSFSLGKGEEAQLSLSGIKLEQVGLHVRGAPAERVSIAAVLVSDTQVDLRNTQVDVKHVSVQGLSTHVVLERDGSLNLARLGGTQPPSARHADVGATGPAWKVRLHSLSVAAALQLEDRAIQPPVHLHVTSLALHATELTLDPERALPFSLTLRLDDHCHLRVAGSVTPAPLSASVEVTLEGARVARAQPYLQPYVDLTVHEGLLGFHGQVELRPALHADPGAAPLEVSGDVSLSGLRTTDNILQQPFVDLERLELTRVRYRKSPERIEVAEVKLQKPYVRLVLSNQQALNVTTILHGSPQAKADVQVSAPTRMSDQHPLANAQLAPRKISIDLVSIDDMRLSFSDHFIRPNFSAELHGLHGTVRGLSSEADALATLSLAGKLGASAPVSISGKLRPFAYTQWSDLQMSWQNVPLPVFNPYSDRFAGYSIVRGDLATQLHYKVRNGKLDAQHHIRVDQLTWGEATATKEQADLPVRLATAMLRDRSGVIALDLPVQGNLTDPNFRVGPLVWQTLKNVALRAATAPFEWLGSLFEGAERARFVDFNPGEDTLNAGDAKELGSLAKALGDRPHLHVDVPLGVEPSLDRKALVERKYQRELKDTIVSELWGARKNEAYTVLDPGDRIDVLEALYKRLTKRSPKLPDPPEAPASSSWSQRRAAKKAFQISMLENMARGAIEVGDDELEQLGLRRANAIEHALTADGKVDSNRVLVSSEGKVRGEQGKVRVELGLQ